MTYVLCFGTDWDSLVSLYFTCTTWFMVCPSELLTKHNQDSGEDVRKTMEQTLTAMTYLLFVYFQRRG